MPAGLDGNWALVAANMSVRSLLHVGVIGGMLVALIRVPRWLLPLAIIGGAVAVVQLLMRYDEGLLYGLQPPRTVLPGITPWTWVNVVQLILAAACAVAGLRAVRRANLAVGDSVGDAPLQLND
jgi:hypothetical protein